MYVASDIEDLSLPFERAKHCSLDGGGTPGGSSANLFLPPGQGQAAGALGSIVNPFAQQSTNALNAMGISPAQLAYPGVLGTASNVLNNPYAAPAVNAADRANNIFNANYAPTAATAATGLSGLAGLAGGAGQSVVNSGFNNPAYGQAASLGQGIAPQLSGAASSILSQSFDPQSALFDRTQSQLSDQTNAGLANSGLAGTPYGASVLGNTLGNFDINWQNNQLNRMTQGGQAATSLDQAAQSSLLTPANNQIAAGLEGASALSSLTGAANTGYGGALGDLSNLATGTASFGALPYNTYNAQQGNNFGALQNEISLGNQNYTLPQQTVNDINSYLHLGQDASKLANTIGSTNFNETTGALSGLGSLAFGNSGLFGGGGSSGGGLLGGSGGLFSAGGLLGSQGPLFGSAADASIAAGGPPLAAAAPLAFSA